VEQKGEVKRGDSKEDKKGFALLQTEIWNRWVSLKNWELLLKKRTETREGSLSFKACQPRVRTGFRGEVGGWEGLTRASLNAKTCLTDPPPRREAGCDVRKRPEVASLPLCVFAR